MMFGRKPLAAASLLVLMMNILRADALTCRRSEYQILDECCPMCPAGNRVRRDCTEYKSTSCQPCTEGTFMNQPNGLRKCFPCADCDRGSGLQTKAPCTATTDTVCEPLEGFYCMSSTEDSCMAAQKHTNCLPGQFISEKGTAFRDTRCTACRVGTYSDGTFTSCQRHTQCESKNLEVITAGTDSTDARCGGKSSTLTGIVVGIVVMLLFLFIGAAVLYYFIKKKKGFGNRGNADNHKPEHQTEEERERKVTIGHRHQQQDEMYLI